MGTGMSRVRILATGATIELDKIERGRRPQSIGHSRIDNGPAVGSIPNIHSLANIATERFAELACQETSEFVRIRLAARINGLFATDSADGIVVTLNTETIEETGYYLHLVLKSDRPVVLTGSPRGLSPFEAQSHLKLYNAVAVAADTNARGRGAVLILNDGFSTQTEVRPDAPCGQTLRSAGQGFLLGLVSCGEIRYFRPPCRGQPTFSQFAADLSECLPRVDILYSHLDMSPDLVAACVCFGACGIVVAALGNGRIPKQVTRELVEVARSGVIVVRSRLLETGDIAWGVEEEAIGLIEAEQLSPQKSRVLLQLCLAKGMNRDEIRRVFECS
jgi:L-asparaginase